MIRDSARGIAERDGGVARARRLRFASPGYDPDVLYEMAALGWFAIRLPEAAGGSALPIATLGLLVHDLGRVLTPEPLVAMTLAARLLAAAEPDGDVLAAHVAGERLATVAAFEGRDGIAVTGTRGPRHAVPAVDTAATVLMVERTADGLALLAYDRDAVDAAPVALQDGGFWATVSPTGTGRLVGRPAARDVDVALEEATLATAFELCGIAAAALDISLDYLRVRQQFGRAIGSFQALQHAAVNLKIEAELAMASARAAAAQIDADADAAAAVSCAKAQASAAAIKVTRAAIQLHGGIGYTDEHDIGLYLRRAMVLASAFGSADWHVRRYADLTRPMAAAA
nr:acyl-CoA dehydrogenase family protein [Acuticoccus mangrovi]